MMPPNLAQALRGVGFEVIEQRDASREMMAKAVHDFSERLRGADVALFFYAGHGLQMNGENYLLPVDAKIDSAADVRFNTINLSDIQQEMEASGRTNIIILDACRNNPFAEKLSHGGRGVTTRGLGATNYPTASVGGRSPATRRLAPLKSFALLRVPASRHVSATPP
jgi:uncharacterized protein